MLEVIYWIIAILTMSTILGFSIYNFVSSVKIDKRIKSFYKKQEEYFTKTINEIDKIKEEN